MRVDDQLCSMLRRYHPLFINTHFNHPKELTPLARAACERLADAGIPLGNQTVLLRGVNDCPVTIKRLMHELVKLRCRPYYLYSCDQSQGLGHFRVPVQAGLDILETLWGHTSGFAIPVFVVDAPGGGGKRDAWSFEHYDRQTGISVYTAPTVRPGAFLYFDPIDLLPEAGQARWRDPAQHQAMIDEATAAAGVAPLRRR